MKNVKLHGHIILPIIVHSKLIVNSDIAFVKMPISNRHLIRDQLIDSWITGNDSMNFLILNYWNAQIVYQHAFPAFVYCDRYLWLTVVSWHWSILLPQVVEGLAVWTIQERTKTSTVQPSGKGYVEKCQERCHPWGKLVILTFCIFVAGETALQLNINDDPLKQNT